MNNANYMPRTYLGLSELILSVRKIPGWSSLNKLDLIEAAIAITYLSIDTKENIKRYQTNDYLRTALTRKTALPSDLLRQLSNDEGIQPLYPLRDFLKTLSQADFPLEYQLTKDYQVSLNKRSDMKSRSADDYLRWIVFEGGNSPLKPDDRISVRYIILYCLTAIGKSCVLPEFNFSDQAWSRLDQFEKLENDGYLVIENFIKAPDLDELRTEIYEIAAQEIKSEIAHLYGANNKLQRVYGLPVKSNASVNLLLMRPEIYELLHRFFGTGGPHTPFYLSSMQANILYQGAESQSVHVDSSTPDPLPPWKIRLNINILLDPFTQYNGATEVFPGSHKLLRRPNDCDVLDLPSRKIIAPAGSLVAWTGHLWHRSTANTEANPRAAILACFAASYLREIALEENYSAILSREEMGALPFEVRTLLGYYHGIKYTAKR